MTDLKIKNGVVSEIVIGLTDTDQLTGWLLINFVQNKQGFGGLDLSHHTNAVTYINNILKIVGVRELNSLVGKAVRVEHDLTKIYAIGNFIEEQWYHIDTGAIETFPPSQTPPAVPNEVNVDDSGLKHHKMNAETGVVGTSLDSTTTPEVIDPQQQ